MVNGAVNVEVMNNVGTTGVGTKAIKKIISHLNVKKTFERAKEFIVAKEVVEEPIISQSYLNKKVSLSCALVEAGSIIFVGSPLKSSELEDILYTFVVFNSTNPGDVKLPTDKKIRNWQEYLSNIDNVKAKEYFFVEEGYLRLTPKAVSYVMSVLNSYTKENAA